MVSDPEAGRNVQHRAIPRWRRRGRKDVRRRPTTQEYIDLVSRLEDGSAVSRTQLDVSAGAFVEYVRLEICKRCDQFKAILPDTVIDDQSKSMWALRAIEKLHQDMTSSRDFSIAVAVAGLQAHGTIRCEPGSERQCTALVFAMMGTMLTLFSPLTSASLEGQLCLDRRYPTRHGFFDAYSNDRVDVTEAERPLRDMLRGFGNLDPTYQTEPEEKQYTILTSQFNAAVFTSIGRIRLAWTDLLPAHLDFDLSTRTLYIYQRPTFCLLNIPLDGKQEQVWRSMLECCLESPNGLPGSNMADYMEEVILSLYLIFGQSPKARKIFRTRRISGGLSKISPDPLLPMLCAGEWPFSDWTRLPQKRYVFDRDFLVLGRKLQMVQDYMSGKQPANIWHLWKDRRNPLQWWTFWAVVVVGGCGLVLSAVQAALSAAQLYYAMHDAGNTPKSRP